MALDEMHARRLATVATVVESALDRIEQLLRTVEKEETARKRSTGFSSGQVQQIRAAIEHVRERLLRGLAHFGVERHQPHPRQVLAAELSMLWVVLENAMPERMKGYGKEFTPADRRAWEELIRTLLQDLEPLRSCTQGGRD